MKCSTWSCVCAVILFASLAMTVPLVAQDHDKRDQPHRYHHYHIIDPGTFGGPQGFLSFVGGLPRAGILNNRGTLTGSADTITVDPYCLDNPDCYAIHALRWRNGVTTDLGVLPGGLTSQVNWISASGLMTGVSDNGQPDPLSGGTLPQLHGVLWEHESMTDLGTLPEGGYQSFPYAVNNRGEVVGQANNTIPDPNSLFGYSYQSRAFYWKDGVMQDLGTLGTGTDALAGLINEHGEVVGWSYTSSTPNATCAGISVFNFNTDSFVWDRRDGVKDIGGLGGTCTLAQDLNNRGQIVGGSSLTGNTTVHPFVWTATTGVTDLLDSSDSSYGFAEGENEHGDVAGGTCDAVTCYAVLWRKSGGYWRKTNLSAVAQAAFAISINASEQVVGNWTGGVFLSDDGGPIVDVSTLVPPGSGLQFSEAQQINDRGEIAVEGSDASGNNHAVLLIPCDEDHPDVDGCDYGRVDASTAAQNAALRSIPNSTQRPFHPSRSNRFHNSALGVGAAALTSTFSPASDVTRPPQFWVAATPLTPSPVNPGGSSTSSVSAGLGNGVATVTLTCSVQPSPPQAPTCSITPTSYIFGGTPSTLTVSTFGPTGRLLSQPSSGVLYALWLPLIGLVGIGVGLGSNLNGQKRKLKTALLACALFPGLAFQLGCGGKGGSGTPAGIYSVTVTATGFIPVASTSTLTTLTVQ
jgi:probable HAF family extracellular repeat protein